MNKKIIIVIVLIILVLICLIAIGIVLSKKNNEIKNEMNQAELDVEDTTIEENKNTELLDDSQTFYTIANIVQKYLNSIANEDTEVLSNIVEDGYSETAKINVNQIFEAQQMYNIDKLTNETVFIYGNIYPYNQVISGENLSKIYLLVNIDNEKGTYNIRISSKSEYDNAMNNIVDNKYREKIYIEKNKDNIIENITISEPDLIKKYFDNFLIKALYNKEEAYQMLDNDYKNKKFGSVDNFSKYIENNRERLELTLKYDTVNNNAYENYSDYQDFKIQYSYLGLTKYDTKRYIDYTQYICMDNDDNYYIFTENSHMQYTVMLDAYTVDIPEITERYNSATDTKKANMNIEKIREAINNKDYRYLYSKLYNEFKNSNYPTQNSLENYLNSNLFNINKFELDDGEMQNDSYIFNIKVTDESSASVESKSITIVLKLEENNDFVFSFTIK